MIYYVLTDGVYTHGFISKEEAYTVNEEYEFPGVWAVAVEAIGGDANEIDVENDALAIARADGPPFPASK